MQGREERKSAEKEESRPSRYKYRARVTQDGRRTRTHDSSFRCWGCSHLGRNRVESLMSVFHPKRTSLRIAECRANALPLAVDPLQPGEMDTRTRPIG